MPRRSAQTVKAIKQAIRAQVDAVAALKPGLLAWQSAGRELASHRDDRPAYFDRYLKTCEAFECLCATVQRTSQEVVSTVDTHINTELLDDIRRGSIDALGADEVREVLGAVRTSLTAVRAVNAGLGDMQADLIRSASQRRIRTVADLASLAKAIVSDLLPPTSTAQWILKRLGTTQPTRTLESLAEPAIAELTLAAGARLDLQFRVAMASAKAALHYATAVRRIPVA